MIGAGTAIKKMDFTILVHIPFAGTFPLKAKNTHQPTQARKHGKDAVCKLKH